MKNPPFELDMPSWLIELLPEMPRHLVLRYDRPTDSFVLHDSEGAEPDRAYSRLNDLDRLEKEIHRHERAPETPVLVDWTTMRGMVDEPCSGILAIPETGTADNWNDPAAWGDGDDEDDAGEENDTTAHGGDNAADSDGAHGPDGGRAAWEDRNHVMLVINDLMDNITRYAEANRIARANIDAWRADPGNGLLAWQALDRHPFAWHITDQESDEPLAPNGRTIMMNGLLPDIIYADVIRQDDGVVRAITESGGRYDGASSITCHDLRLDVVATTTDEMYVKTMKLVDKYFNDDGTPKQTHGKQ